MNAVAVIYLLFGLINLACAALCLGGGVFLAEISGVDLEQRAGIGGIAGVLALICMAFGLPEIITAYGIWNRQYWGYVLGLVLAGVNALFALYGLVSGDLCNLFFSGSFSIFALVVLLNSRYAAEFS